MCAASVATGSPARSGLSKYEMPSVSSSSSRRSIGGRPRSMRQPTSELMRHPGAAPPVPRPHVGAGAASPRSCRRPWRAGRRLARSRPRCRRSPAANGNSPSLTRRTVPSVATRRATARRPGSSDSALAGARRAAAEDPHPAHEPQDVAHLAINHRLVDLSGTHRRGQRRAEPGRRSGISRSSPATAAGAVECVPNQSDMTSPSKPHSRRSTPPIRSGCSPQ